jgi:hypothetical protein
MVQWSDTFSTLVICLLKLYHSTILYHDKAKDFTGHMDIIQTVKVPMLNYPSAPPPMYTDIPTGLKPRWKPFGHRKLPCFKKAF